MGTIRLGTSGWDYPEWTGRVYPPQRGYGTSFVSTRAASRSSRSTPRSTGSPPVAVAESWARRTPAEFRFAAKFPQTITHDRRLVGTAEELKRFLAVLRPLQAAGKLAAALLQLPPSLKFEPGTVRTFYESLPPTLPVAVEFREPSWLEPASIDLLREFRLAYTVVDEPMLPIQLETTAPFAYVRWHGHGREVWYDYTYSAEELAAWVPRVQQLSERVPEVSRLLQQPLPWRRGGERGDAPRGARPGPAAVVLPPWVTLENGCGGRPSGRSRTRWRRGARNLIGATTATAPEPLR